jgi:hypothetical protein
LKGDDDDVMAFTVMVDPEPVTDKLVLVVAHLEGGGVYALVPAKEGREIHWVEPDHRWVQRYPTHVRHLCDVRQILGSDRKLCGRYSGSTTKFAVDTGSEQDDAGVGLREA